MLSRMFYNHGHICASHPWEVIVAFLTLTISMISMGAVVPGTKLCTWIYQCSTDQDGKGMDAVVMTIARCMALFYIYHQFRKLYKLGSKYLVGIAGLFTVFSSFVFSSSVVNLLEGNFSELNKALPFFLLLIDLSKAGLLAQFALSSCSQAEVRENIARGMAALGPSITLDTIVEALVIGVGTLSGVKRLEELCCFACMSAIVNYVVFMTFFPACLSLVLELSKEREEGRPVWQLSSLTKVLQHEQQQKPNPVLQRVKVIMSAGLLLVHAHSRWPLVMASSSMDHQSSIIPGGNNKLYLATSNSAWRYTLDRWLTVGSEQMVMLVLACALAVKYIFFESNDELKEHLAAAAAAANSQRNSFANFQKKSYSSLKHLHEESTENLLKRRDSTPLPSPVHERTQVPTFIIGDDYVPTIKKSVDKFSQTYRDQFVESDTNSEEGDSVVEEIRSLHQCKAILNTEDGPQSLTNDEIILLIRSKELASYKLESILGNPERGVGIRRKLIADEIESNCEFSKLPYRNYDYSLVMGACCENVIGYMPIPVGVAGPLRLDGRNYHVPMATTEGCLVASTNRGCRALSISGGVRSSVVANGMTRGPVIRLPSAIEAADVMKWIDVKENFEILKLSFDSTSRFARLKRLHVRIAGRYLFVRFVSETGDAMGMNMLSKGTELALQELQKFFPNVEILSLSGNYCTDKKPAAVNWIEGRGKSVVCEAQIPSHVVQDVLKTSVEALVEVNLSKNLIGSAIAGSIGGYNAQAANIVTAIYIATGQDPAQNVGSSNCMTLMEAAGPDGQDLYITCTMPSIEIGTVGGGTVLPPQAACLEMLGVLGADMENPGENACRLARIVCGTVLAGELSLLSALAAGHLVRSHMKHNRSQLSINLSTSSLGSSTGCHDEKNSRSRNPSSNFLSPNNAILK